MNPINHYSKKDSYKYEFYRGYLKYINKSLVNKFIHYSNKEAYEYYTIYEKYINKDLYNLENNLLRNKQAVIIPPRMIHPPPLPPSRPPPLNGSTYCFNNNTEGLFKKNPKPLLNNKTAINSRDSVYNFGATYKDAGTGNTDTLMTLDLKKFLNKYIDAHVPLVKKRRPLQLSEEEETYEFKILDEKIEDLIDLIRLGKKYETEYKDKQFRFNLNLRILSLLVKPLEELNNMIGMSNIKNSIFNKIILYLQGLDNKHTDYNHIVLYGGPGMGKTHVAKIIGEIYAKMGFLSKGDFKQIKLTDLKAGFVGQTEIKTQKLLDSSLGCVLFLDEAYSLGGNDKLDSFSQSIIDTINPFLDKHKDDFILIVAGYKTDLEERFFKGNQGLRSRFGLWLEINEYDVEDLKKIFIKQILEYGWKYVSDDITTEFFKKNKKYFKFFGRDIQNLFSKCKISHAKRVLFCEESEKKTINKDDLKNGFELYKNHLDTASDMDSDIMYSMYT
tara:strand:+ start:4984 stop:6483 length:1500 start_codon:yes stop_codon:yes gene_type:complete